MEEKEFRFAILGAGNIAGAFANTVRGMDGVTVCAVASKSAEWAKQFADKNGIPTSYGDYRELLQCEKPDAVYIATTPDSHASLCMLALEHGVPVLCEKAMFVSSREAEQVFAYSEAHGVFAMEALWSRFLPANRKAVEWLREGRIGELILCDSSIGFTPDKNPEMRYFSPKLCGGAATDLTCYAYEIAELYRSGEPLSCDVRVIPAETGVDAAESVMLTYGDGITVINTSFIASYQDHLILYGTKGRIEIPHPHYASTATLYENGCDPVTFDEPHEGFAYEIREAVSCIRGGRVESAVVPHALTLACARLFDKIHAQCPAYAVE